MTADKDKKARARIIKKIRALRNKTVAAGCTEDEAKASAELLRKLMDKYKVTEAELRADVAGAGAKKQRPRTADMTDYWANLETHQYWFVPTRKLHPAETIRSLFGKFGPAELDNFRAVHSTTWAPGRPPVIMNELAHEGGMTPAPGKNTFNLYRPPLQIDGNPNKIKEWMKHGDRMWGEYWPHILKWLGWRVQRPDVKINHGIVMGSMVQGIGKDMLMAPVRRAVGEWNFKDVQADRAFKYASEQNSFLESVILRINEAHELGDDRFAFYDRTKDWMAAPPETLNVVDKWIKQHAMMNLTGCLITTNHRTDGLYIPAEDRRHYAAWSDIMPEEFSEQYWNDFANWLIAGGTENVAAFLATMQLDDFDPKARPPKTEFWHAMVNANRHHETSGLLDVLDHISGFDNLGRRMYPAAITADRLRLEASMDRKFKDTFEFLSNRGNKRQFPHRLEKIRYTSHQNKTNSDGLWSIDGVRQVVYVRQELTPEQRQTAALAIANGLHRLVYFSDDGEMYEQPEAPTTSTWNASADGDVEVPAGEFNTLEEDAP